MNTYVLATIIHPVHDHSAKCPDTVFITVRTKQDFQYPG